MSANVLLNILNELGNGAKCVACRESYCIFSTTATEV